MRRLIIALSCMLAGPAFAADSQIFQMRNTADLVRVCTVPPGDANHETAIGFCHGILVGAYGYYTSAVAGPNRFVCSPNPTPTRNKVMNDFVAWTNAHASYASAPAVDTLFKYLAETYPCTK